MTTADKIYKCWLHLVNGWTVSISADDTPPSLCSVAAWPTTEDLERTTPGSPWFIFADGGQQQRCHSLEDIRLALKEVEDAPPP